jgi:DNA invertase Pin-like site-specific DNA recombinase
MRVGLYARVSSNDQNPEGQLDVLRAFAIARGWDATEFVDHGVSGAKESRPALDAMLQAVGKRKLDVVACVKLDRLARSLHQLVAMGQEFEALGVHLVVTDQNIDTTTPTGRLSFHMIAAFAEFERDLINERVRAGMARVKAHGTKSGRPVGRPTKVNGEWEPIRHLVESGQISQVEAARRLGCARATVQRMLGAGKGDENHASRGQ